MERIKIPYHNGFQEVEIPRKNIAAFLKPKAGDCLPQLTESDIVARALDNPVGSEGLEKLVVGKENMVIITSDHTRPMPSKVTMPILLGRIRRANPDIAITILVATGYHRSPTREEITTRFGSDIVENEKIVIHDCKDSDSMVHVGVLPSGGDLLLNKVALDTELLIAEGFIEPHFFAGFSGGRKSVLPGIASEETVMANHCAEFIANENARTGVLDNNPIHRDMLYAAQRAGLSFILNVVLDGKKRIINAFAGDSERAHAKGCNYVMELSQVNPVKADIVISSNGGYPLDQNVYQAVKGITSAEATCKKDGVIIMVAGCCDGHGGQSFYDNLKKAQSPQVLLDEIRKVPSKETQPDQWQFQILARVLKKHPVIFVTDMCDPQLIRDMKMDHAHTLEEAVQKAFRIKGKEAKITVIPDGVAVIVN
ncbi:MAG: nickel-dependent lactate racemase [Firmicutes bacterium]|nr:nickel-dependent lactate racemase [Bacillota bacterium]